MYPAQIVVEALKKVGSIQTLAQLVGVTDQSVRNWLNFVACPTDARLKQLMSVTVDAPPSPPQLTWEERQQKIETRYKAPVKAEPTVQPKRSWKQRVEITRIHQNADYAFGVTSDALITFIVPHVADKLKDAGIENGDEVTLVVRDNEHPNADLYAFKWIEDDTDGY